MTKINSIALFLHPGLGLTLPCREQAVAELPLKAYAACGAIILRPADLIERDNQQISVQMKMVFRRFRGLYLVEDALETNAFLIDIPGILGYRPNSIRPIA